MSHANIATVYEINEHEGQTFIAMECIEGETIAEKRMGVIFKFSNSHKAFYFYKDSAPQFLAAHFNR